MDGANKSRDRDWVVERIETRVERGEKWRQQIEKHRHLAQALRYVRILGGGFRPVSISDNNPCGHLRAESKGEIKTSKKIETAIRKADVGYAIDHKPKAKKPEHKIQAFIIRTALQDEDHFGRFHRLFSDCSDVFDELIFVTDEFSINNGSVRADIVALGGKDGHYFPVFIELKNARSLTRLKNQLNSAHDFLWKDDRARVSFRRFLQAVTGVPLDDILHTETAVRKMIIWPNSPSGEEDQSVNEARKNGFLIMDFEIVGGEAGYRFSRKTPSQSAALV